MIIWINGAFGSGKTQTAHELHRRLAGSYIYDPENAGYFIRKNVPEEAACSDFQHYPMWRDFNYAMLKYIKSTYSGVVIVPMTVTNPGYLQEMAGRLRDEGVEVRHFTLGASKEVVLKRLRKRGEGGGSWAAQQLDRCIEAFADPVFEHRLDTDHMTVEMSAERIAAMCGITLLPDRRGWLRRKIDRLKVQLKQIRIFK